MPSLRTLFSAPNGSSAEFTAIAYENSPGVVADNPPPSIRNSPTTTDSPPSRSTISPSSFTSSINHGRGDCNKLSTPVNGADSLAASSAGVIVTRTFCASTRSICSSRLVNNRPGAIRTINGSTCATTPGIANSNPRASTPDGNAPNFSKLTRHPGCIPTALRNTHPCTGGANKSPATTPPPATHPARNPHTHRDRSFRGRIFSCEAGTLTRAPRCPFSPPRQAQTRKLAVPAGSNARYRNPLTSPTTSRTTPPAAPATAPRAR